MKVRIPKDIEKYLHPALAGMRLISIALDQILCVNPDRRVKWQLKVWYHIPQEVMDKIKSPAVAMRSTFSSGNPIDGVYDVREKKETSNV